MEPSATSIRADALRDIAAHAREAWPNECCGLLLGTAGTIQGVYRVRNVDVDDSRTRYLVCPEDHFEAIRFARAHRLDLVGAYHSHPAGRPRPSATDRDEAQAGGFLYVIAGTRRLRRAWWPPRARCWRGAEARRGARRAARRRRARRYCHTRGCWVAAWRLVEGNFVQVPLVRLP